MLRPIVLSVVLASVLSASAFADPRVGAQPGTRPGARPDVRPDGRPGRGSHYIPRRQRPQNPGAVAPTISPTSGRAYALAMQVSQQAEEAAEAVKRVEGTDVEPNGRDRISQAETVAVAKIVAVGYQARKYADVVAKLESRYSLWDDASKVTLHTALSWLGESKDLLNADPILFNSAVMSPGVQRQLRELRDATEGLIAFGRRVQALGFGLAEAEVLSAELAREISVAKQTVKNQINGGRNFDATVDLVRRLDMLEREAATFRAEVASLAQRGVYVSPRQALNDNYDRLSQQMFVIDDITENYARYGLAPTVDRAFDRVDAVYGELRVVFGF